MSRAPERPICPHFTPLTQGKTREGIPILIHNQLTNCRVSGTGNHTNEGELTLTPTFGALCRTRVNQQVPPSGASTRTVGPTLSAPEFLTKPERRNRAGKKFCGAPRASPAHSCQRTPLTYSVCLSPVHQPGIHKSESIVPSSSKGAAISNNSRSSSALMWGNHASHGTCSSVMSWEVLLWAW